jgi:hypothetical protein
VAQLQISSVLEHSARSLASELVDSILAILPDGDGRTHWSTSQTHNDGTGKVHNRGE